MLVESIPALIKSISLGVDSAMLIDSTGISVDPIALIGVFAVLGLSQKN